MAVLKFRGHVLGYRPFSRDLSISFNLKAHVFQIQGRIFNISLKIIFSKKTKILVSSKLNMLKVCRVKNLLTEYLLFSRDTHSDFFFFFSQFFGIDLHISTHIFNCGNMIFLFQASFIFIMEMRIYSPPSLHTHNIHAPFTMYHNFNQINHEYLQYWDLVFQLDLSHVITMITFPLLPNFLFPLELIIVLFFSFTQFPRHILAIQNSLLLI